MRPPALPVRKDIRHPLIEPDPPLPRPLTPPLRTLPLPLLPRRPIQTIRQVDDRVPPHERLLMIILDVDIDDMHRPVQRRAPGQQIIHHGVPAPFLARNHHVHDTRLHPRAASVGAVLQPRPADAPVLPALRAPLDILVALQHVEEAVGAVEARVFGGELVVDGGVGRRVEGVHVRLRDAGPGQSDQGARAEGEDGVVRGGEAEVGFHGSGGGRAWSVVV